LIPGKKRYFSVHLLLSCFADPFLWIMGLCFAPCFTFIQRKEMLGDRFNEDYRLCQDAFGPCWCPCIAVEIPLVCLVLESFLCTGLAIGGNRFHLIKTRGLKNTPLEWCLILTLITLAILSIPGHLLAGLVHACFLTQHQRELDDEAATINV